MKRVLIYSQDTLEAGDLRCMRSLARRLLQASGRVELRVISGAPALNGVADWQAWEGISNITLPGLRQARSTLSSTAHPMLTLGAALQLRKQLIRNAIVDFAPDLILVDRMPCGRYDELGKVLAALKSAQAGVKCVLLLRDVIGSPKRTAQQWRDRGYFDAMSEHYDKVLVLGEQEVFDLRREYAMPEPAAAKLAYCGYAAAPPGRSERTRVRRALGVPGNEPLVLVVGGEAKDGEVLIRAYLQGLQLMPAEERPRSHVVCGAAMSEPERLALACAAHAMPQVSIQQLSRDVMSLMSAASVVVTNGGYQTTCELLTLRRRAVVVPSTAQADEQTLRAERLAGHGLLRLIRPAELQAQRLMSAVLAELVVAVEEMDVCIPQRVGGIEFVTSTLLGLIDLEDETTPGALTPAELDGMASPPTDGFDLSLGNPNETGVFAPSHGHAQAMH